MTHNHLVIIGSGLAGYTLAREFREHDKDSTLTFITQEEGIYYSKPLLSSALSNAKALSTLKLHEKEKMEQSLNATILAHTSATAIDLTARLVTTDKSAQGIPYTQLVLAMGATPKLPPIAGNGVADILQINNLVDYEIFRQRLSTPGMTVTILGAGLIGSELANDLSKSGYKVNLICSSSAPLPRLLPQALGEVMIDALKQQNATVVTNQRAVAVEKHGAGFITTLQDNSTYQSDLVLAAVGLSPNTTLAAQAGLVVNRGIVANTYGQTSDSAVFTLGDCAEIDGQLHQFVMPIMQASKPLGLTLAGTLTAIEYPWMPVSAKTACAMTAIPPAMVDGAWEITGEAPNLEATYRDKSGKAIGFALVGEATAKRREYMAMLDEAVNP
jgi:rubredoxin-NAD+ reductase